MSATGAAPGRGPARTLPGLLAGLVGLDVVMNLAALDAAHGAGRVVTSLLAPSIDLLIVVAALMGGARGTGGPQRALRAGVAAGGVLLIVLRAGLRFGWASPLGAAGWLIAAAAAVGAGAAICALTVPVLRGLSNALVRSAALLAIALAAVIQVLFSRTVFTGSALAAVIRGLITTR